MERMEGFVETYRGGVTAWECDVFGHLNIAFYVERFADAASDLLERHAPGRQWRTLALDTRYERELRAGEGVAIQSAIIAVGEHALRIGHVAVNSANGKRTTLAEHDLAPESMRGWDETREALVRNAAAWQEPALAPVRLPAGEGPIASGRDRVKPWEADHNGTLSLLGHLQRFSTACLHVVDAVGLDDEYRRTARRGYATFETRLLLESAPAVGEGVALASAVIDAGNSSLRMFHRMSPSRGGAAIASFYQAGVHFDLETRRSAPLPEEIRARALALRVAA